MSSEGESLEERAYREIKEAIMTVRAKPGEKLDQSEWAERLGISRTPVREALKRLTLEGFVTSDTQREWRVYTLSVEDVRQLYELREAVECYVARAAAARMTPEAQARLQRIIAAMDEAVAADDRRSFRRADLEFHDLLLELAGNPHLARVSAAAHEKLRRFRRDDVSLPGRIAGTLQENRRIAEALAARDPAAAEAAQRDHLRASAATLLNLLEHLLVPLMGPRF
jgi:DNA-binding GntR family transcriptional regulator